MKKPIAIILFCIATINLDTSLFAQSSRSAPNISSIETKSIDQIIAYLNNLPENTKLPFVKLTERLWDIAFFDHHIPIQKRRTAISVLEALIKDVEKAFNNYPDTLRLYRQANKLKEDEISYFGYGSLQWKIEENNISPDQVHRYIMTIENAPLLNNYFELLGEQAKEKAMPALIKELIYSRQYKRVDNAVLILHGLAAKGDLAVQAVFSDKDSVSIMRASSNYKQAREVLVKFNLLSTTSDAKPLFPKPTDDIITEFILASSNLKKDSGKWEESDELIELHDSLHGEQKDFILISVLLLRIHLWLSTIRDIYGDAAFRNINEKVLAKFKKTKTLGMENWLRAFQLVEDQMQAKKHKFDLETSTAIYLMSILGVLPKDKEMIEKEKAFLTKVVRIFNLERVYSLKRIRFYLRYLVGNYPEQSKETERDVVDLLKALLRGETAILYSSEDEIRIPR